MLLSIPEWIVIAVGLWVLISIVFVLVVIRTGRWERTSPKRFGSSKRK